MPPRHLPALGGAYGTRPSVAPPMAHRVGRARPIRLTHLRCRQLGRRRRSGDTLRQPTRPRDSGVDGAGRCVDRTRRGGPVAGCRTPPVSGDNGASAGRPSEEPGGSAAVMRRPCCRIGRRTQAAPWKAEPWASARSCGRLVVSGCSSVGRRWGQAAEVVAVHLPLPLRLAGEKGGT